MPSKVGMNEELKNCSVLKSLFLVNHRQTT